MNDLEFVEYYREWIEINFLFKMDIWNRKQREYENRDSTESRIESFLYLSFNYFILQQRKTDIHANTIKIVSDMCSRTLSEEEGRYKG